MPNYRESIGEATSWRRVHAVRFANPLNHPAGARVTFYEEDAVTVGDRSVRTPAGEVGATFDPPATFALINPATGAPTGMLMTHMDLYVALNSLYLDLALKRDAAEAAEAAQPPEDPPPGPPTDPPTGPPPEVTP
jgi:hypothetical protein